MHSHALTLRELQRQDMLAEADHARLIQQHRPVASHTMRHRMRHLMITCTTVLTTMAALRLPRRLTVHG